MLRAHLIGIAALAALACAPHAAAQDFDYGPLQAKPTPEAIGAVMDRAALAEPGAHHFELSYCTAAPGVVLPPDLRARYPVEITIVLQWQYWNLVREGDLVRVTVSFNQQPTRITIPLSALTTFRDQYAGITIPLRAGANSEERCAGMGATI